MFRGIAGGLEDLLKFLIVIAGLAFSTQAFSFEVKLPDGKKLDFQDGTYVAYFKKGCGSLSVENGKATEFVTADGCADLDFAKPTLKVGKISVKGNLLRIGTAKYRVESIENGIVRGEWSYGGWTGPIVFLLKK
jgi:hypothetical protein